MLSPLSAYSDMDQVQLMIKNILPSLTPESLASLLACLNDCGVESLEDFGLIEEKNLSGCLKPVQIRKLLSFKSGGMVPNLHCVSRQVKLGHVLYNLILLK